ncbi:MAG: hypothetical protein MZU97_18645 [Bacillus subtilis]|nr:hypothetical protein [Bacillus subtilis]
MKQTVTLLIAGVIVAFTRTVARFVLSAGDCLSGKMRWPPPALELLSSGGVNLLPHHRLQGDRGCSHSVGIGYPVEDVVDGHGLRTGVGERNLRAAAGRRVATGTPTVRATAGTPRRTERVGRPHTGHEAVGQLVNRHRHHRHREGAQQPRWALSLGNRCRWLRL